MMADKSDAVTDRASQFHDGMADGDADIELRAQARIGTVLRRKYRLESVLGIGGMAVVYRAVSRSHGEVAIKMLHPELSVRRDIRSRFRREGRATKSVKHPGVVAILDDDVAEDGSAFLVMELLHGASVECLWERCGQRLTIRAALSLGSQLLDALAAAHARGIVHRDVKPANLFATWDGTLKILDFGIARVKDAAASQGGRRNTGSGYLLGTPAFMAPEQALAQHEKIGPQTDLWAVGATLFTLLTGQTVHLADNMAQLVVTAATQHARPVRSVDSNIPHELAEVIDRALAFEKRDRWSNAAAMLYSLERVSLALFGEQTAKTTIAALVSGEELGEDDDLTRVVGHAAAVAPPVDSMSLRRDGRATTDAARVLPLVQPHPAPISPYVHSSRLAWGLGLAAVVGVAGVVAATAHRDEQSAVRHASSTVARPIASAASRASNAISPPGSARATPRLPTTITPIEALPLVAPTTSARSTSR